MRVKDIARILEGKIISGSNYEAEVQYACASDMVNDILTYVKKEGAVLLTGICTERVIRTAELLNMPCIVLVRGKQPEEAILKLALEKNVTIILTPYRMYRACGALYKEGVESEG